MNENLQTQKPNTSLMQGSAISIVIGILNTISGGTFSLIALMFILSGGFTFLGQHVILIFATFLLVTGAVCALIGGINLLKSKRSGAVISRVFALNWILAAIILLIFIVNLNSGKHILIGLMGYLGIIILYPLLVLFLLKTERFLVFFKHMD